MEQKDVHYFEYVSKFQALRKERYIFHILSHPFLVSHQYGKSLDHMQHHCNSEDYY